MYSELHPKIYTMRNQPILLIEFEQNQTFTFQAINDLKSVININNISSKLVLLTLIFPLCKNNLVFKSSRNCPDI
ncbi:hypothetical protein C2G38_228084 [Gigaspora rosea]|uniref:Uncharacterized protein n=1 Tax=Gigaspora rosea TaxID=44941 RepID=A0A397UKD1_9GLOM|nr:hypothetical protein C2G38_228084 [Gigaspora rosea]